MAGVTSLVRLSPEAVFLEQEHRDWDGNSPIIQMIEMVDILRYL